MDAALQVTEDDTWEYLCPGLGVLLMMTKKSNESLNKKNPSLWRSRIKNKLLYIGHWSTRTFLSFHTYQRHTPYTLTVCHHA